MRNSFWRGLGLIVATLPQRSSDHERRNKHENQMVNNARIAVQRPMRWKTMQSFGALGDGAGHFRLLRLRSAAARTSRARPGCHYYAWARTACWAGPRARASPASTALIQV